MGRTKAIVASYVGVVVFASVIFIAAGRLAYWQGLLYLALALAGTTLNHLLAKPGSSQAADRASEAQAGESWDKRLLGASFLLSIGSLVPALVAAGVLVLRTSLAEHLRATSSTRRAPSGGWFRCCSSDADDGDG